MSIIAVHVKRDSPKQPGARFSIYVQPHRKGISTKRFILIRYVYVDADQIETVRWIRKWPAWVEMVRQFAKVAQERWLAFRGRTR